MDLTGKKVLVVGSGISGIGAVTLLANHGAHPVLFDSNRNLNIEDLEKKIPSGISCEIIIGELSKAEETEIELLVISPGVPIDCELVTSFSSREIPVWGEIELAFQFEKGNVLAITGTNGKTTTTSLLGEIMNDYMHNAFVVGNIGNPYTTEVSKTSEKSVTVAEISSFQLETVHTFRPKVSAILNITPDHLNRHHTLEIYAATKESIARNQSKEDTCVLNYEDPHTKEFGEKTTAKVFYFSSQHKLEKGIYLENDVIYLADGESQTALMNIHEMKLLGTHNVENVMAAIAMAYSYKVPMDSILTTVKKFKAVEHRIEYVATKNGVDYYNDSKGTNPDAAIKGIRAMTKPTVLIGGGYDKDSEFDEWIEAFDGKVKCLVLLGQTKEKIAECAKKHGFSNIQFAESLEETVTICASIATTGDAVLLSPACASWGMFPNYEVRGNIFKELVNGLKE